MTDFGRFRKCCPFCDKIVVQRHRRTGKYECLHCKARFDTPNEKFVKNKDFPIPPGLRGH